MVRDACFRLTLGVYYLALGTWFGATVMMGVTAATTFRVVRAYQPQLDSPLMALPEFAGHAPEYLAGNIVNGGFGILAIIQVICAAVIVVTAVLQCTAWRRHLRAGAMGRANLLRLALVIVPIAVLAANLLLVRPPMRAQRAAMYDIAATPQARESARRAFDGYHATSERMASCAALLVAAAAIASPFAFADRPRGDADG